MDIPISDFAGYIKQVPSDGLTTDGMAFLNQHFPGFFEEQSLAKKLQSQGINYVVTSRGTRATRTGRLRRYSGGVSLERQRYFTLCERPDGYDGGTLLNELYAYSDRSPEKRIALLDSTESSATKSMIEQHVGGALPYPHCLAVIVFPADKAGNPIGPADIGLYRLNVFQVRIVGMLDLRYKHVQDWFFSTFAELENSRGEEGVSNTKMIKRRINSFRQMLPTLVCQERGGSILHDAIGDWLRSHSVSALAFPSARTETRVRSSELSVESFSGWNIVVYAGAPPSTEGADDVTFGRMGGWYREEEVKIKSIHWVESGTTREWRIERR